VNTVLQYAIDNQHRTRALLSSVYGLRQDDLDDCAQQVLFAILQANPQNADYPQQYWSMTIRSVAYNWGARRARERRHLAGDDLAGGERLPNRMQDDPAALAETREEITAALAAASGLERESLSRLLSGPEAPSATDRVRIHRFRRRLQGAMA